MVVALSTQHLLQDLTWLESRRVLEQARMSSCSSAIQDRGRRDVQGVRIGWRIEMVHQRELEMAVD